MTAGTSRTVKLWRSRISKADRSVPTKRRSASPVASAAHRTSPLRPARPTYCRPWKANVTVARLRLPGSCSRSSPTNEARRRPNFVVIILPGKKELLGKMPSRTEKLQGGVDKELKRRRQLQRREDRRATPLPRSPHGSPGPRVPGPVPCCGPPPQREGRAAPRAVSPLRAGLPVACTGGGVLAGAPPGLGDTIQVRPHGRAGSVMNVRDCLGPCRSASATGSTHRPAGPLS
jgi:hypothetical protein